MHQHSGAPEPKNGIGGSPDVFFLWIAKNHLGGVLSFRFCNIINYSGQMLVSN